MSTVPVRSVSEITRIIRDTLEGNLRSVCVEGEISGLNEHSSGHAYFSLKDSGALLNVTFFAAARRGSSVQLKNGMKIRAYGAITVFEARGQYQLNVRTVEELSAAGDLMKRFEELKQRLAAEGLFDSAKKRPLPFLPRRIGIVTSPTGAAVQDILSVLERRFPNIQVLIAPARVQGEGAALSIVKALNYLNDHYGTVLDVIIVGRGGGSMEDLWCFNDETVVRAVRASRIPVISAVGHEIDFTLCDFAADLRAATPSAAAEILVGRKDDFENRLTDASRRMKRVIDKLYREPDERLTRSVKHLEAHLRRLPNEFAQRIDTAYLRLSKTGEIRLLTVRGRVDALLKRGEHALSGSTKPLEQKILGLSARLNSLDPLNVLERGFSITSREDGTILRSVADVSKGQRIRTRLKDGILESGVG